MYQSSTCSAHSYLTEVLTHVLSHLPPTTLSDVSLVSKRFHHLVTTPHAWRIAFARYFPGIEAMKESGNSQDLHVEADMLHTERRFFTRLSPLSSWRSEYIIRTRLLRSLSRGKPAETPGASASGSSRPGNTIGGSAHLTFNSNLVTTVDHLHASFGDGPNKGRPRLVHGTTDLGMASSSDPKIGKVDSWGFADAFTPQQFADIYPGEEAYGLGPGDIVGMPNIMDISQSNGMLYAEGMPNGRAYYRSMEEKRGRELVSPLNQSFPQLGIPAISHGEAAFTSAWISKTSNIPELSDGLFGMLTGSSQGVLSSYSLGTNPLREKRLERGELTARWLLCPGVPIVAIVVDENTTVFRQSQNTMIAAVLNALGEVFYLTKIPFRPSDHSINVGSIAREKLAWTTGRSVFWHSMEPTVRTPKPAPHDESQLDITHSPKSSWNGMDLNRQQLIKETEDLTNFLRKKPKDFRCVFENWDMRCRMEVDFAAVDAKGIRESVFIISCGLNDGQTSGIKRITRLLLPRSSEMRDRASSPYPESELHLNPRYKDANSQYLDSFRGYSVLDTPPNWSFDSVSSSSAPQPDATATGSVFEEWRTSVLSFGDVKLPQITAAAVDPSRFAMMTAQEDPLLGKMDGSSTATSPTSSPLASAPVPISVQPSDIPGQRARILAVGTRTGTILLWNMRAPIANKKGLVNEVKPIRIIRTDSPQISCLALTALYLVHGGNDGLVQAWDPLASSIDPVRTFNSRFSSRARRRLVQAEASPAGVGVNLFAAGAICLDPDPTVLRGVVSLGSHLRYWSYSSNAVDQYRGNKRRPRRSERGSNQDGDRFSGTGRGALKEYIANEKTELERDNKLKRKEDEKRSRLYGLDLLGPGATEDEMLAYATMLSKEAAEHDEQRRKSASEDSSSEAIKDEAAPSPVKSPYSDNDIDIAEAIRLSLQESHGHQRSILEGQETGGSNFTVRYTNKKRSSPSTSPRIPTVATAISNPQESTYATHAETAEIELALQISRAEEETRLEEVEGSETGAKGKGRARAI